MLRLFPLILLILATPAFAQGGGKGKVPKYRLFSGLHSGTYEDRSKNETTEEQSELEEVKLTGQTFRASAQYYNFDFEVDLRLLFPNQDFWSRRSEYSFNVSYYWPRFIHIQPVLGYVQAHQSGNRDHVDAPAAFIERNRVLSLGLRSTVAPYMFNAVHGTVFHAQVLYLTSFEKKSNFGTEFTAALGYLYVEQGRRIGLLLGYQSNFFNGTVEDEDNAGRFLHVRHEYVLNTVGVYFDMP